VVLFIEADGSLGMVLILVKQAKELPVTFPIPAGIVDVHETFILDLVRNFAERWKNVRRGRALRPEALFFRQAKGTDASENFQPGQKEPTERRDCAEHPAAGYEVNGQKRGDENAKRSGLLGKRALKTPQR